MKCTTLFLMLLGFLLWVLSFGCSPQIYYYPQFQPKQVKVIWPKLTLTGRSYKKLMLVRAEFVRQGWDAERIEMLMDGENSVVKAMIEEGDVDIPVGEQELDSIAKGAVQGVAASYRPVSASGYCQHIVKTNKWELSMFDTEIIAELKRPYGWEYKHGKKTRDLIIFTKCVQSITRLKLSNLPWEGNWVSVMEDPSYAKKYPLGDEVLRAWIKEERGLPPESLR